MSINFGLFRFIFLVCILAHFSETIIDEMMQRLHKPDVVLADITLSTGQLLEYRLADVPSAEKLEKFVEDVKWVYWEINFW